MKFLIATALLALPASVYAQDAATKQYIDGAFGVMDGNKDGKVDRAEFETFMLARLARQAKQFDESFATLDANRDGGIDAKEAAVHSVLAANFAQVDTNSDGKITKDELRTAMIAAQAAEAGAE